MRLHEIFDPMSQLQIRREEFNVSEIMEYCSAQIVKPDSPIQIKEIVINMGFLFILNI